MNIYLFFCRQFVTDLYSLYVFFNVSFLKSFVCLSTNLSWAGLMPLMPSYLKCTVAFTCNWKYCYEIFKPYMQWNILFMQKYIVFRKYIWRIQCVTVNWPRIWTVDKFEILYMTQTVHVRLHVMLAASVQNDSCTVI